MNGLKTIYCAGGCFWGIEKYLSMIPGVTETKVGYANGRTEQPTYEEVCRDDTGHAETVMVRYDPAKLSLTFLLETFYEAIDPTSLNRQGGDTGTQYRTGIYFTDEADREIILGSLALLQESHSMPVMIEAAPLSRFWPAEEYHQKYLDKNTGGYCHISPKQFAYAQAAADKTTRYRKPEQSALRDKLTDIQFEVTQNNATEPPFQNAYHDNFEPGIYVDITTGEPLFVSADKFDAGCGWPSFSKPITLDLLAELPDHSHNRERTEIRSQRSDAHLGHVFTDGPGETGLRYCINSAALRFVPRADMAAAGYGHLLDLVDANRDSQK